MCFSHSRICNININCNKIAKQSPTFVTMLKNALTDLESLGSDNVDGHRMSDGINHIGVQSRTETGFKRAILKFK
jgi:hypothetical protein